MLSEGVGHDLPGATAILELRDVKKSFGGREVLHGVTLSARPGVVVGLVGENGAGKSTLLKLMAGIEKPDAGSVAVHGEEIALTKYADAMNLGISMVFQEQALVLNMSVAENVYLGLERFFLSGPVLRRREMRRRARKLFDGLGISGVNPGRQLGTYEFSKRQLVEVARAFAVAEVVGAAHPVILLDEATASLGGHERQILFDLISRLRDRAAIVFVSHILAEVLDVCDELVVLKDGSLVTTVSAASVTTSDLHRLITGRERPQAFYLEERQRAEYDDVVFSCEQLGQGAEFSDVTLQVRGGEVLGVAGVIGSGKESLGRVIAGLERFDHGRSSGPDRAHTGYVPKERKEEGVIGPQSVMRNATLAALARGGFQRFGVIRLRAEVAWTRDLIRRLDVRPPDPRAAVDELSGGNQQKVAMGRWLSDTPKLLVLDSPTRGVDVGSRHEIYRLIRDLTDSGVGVVVISDDLLEVIGISDRIVAMRDRRVVEIVDASTQAKPTERQLVELLV